MVPRTTTRRVKCRVGKRGATGREDRWAERALQDVAGNRPIRSRLRFRAVILPDETLPRGWVIRLREWICLSRYYAHSCMAVKLAENSGQPKFVNFPRQGQSDLIVPWVATRFRLQCE